MIDNIPLSGFKLGDSIRSSGYGGYDKWRIEDPRGFELEITSGNLAQLISVGMIDRGEIIDQCVWARLGKDNVLLSTSTDVYKQAVQNTIVANTKANWRDVKPGDGVVLQNNLRGVWLGKMYRICRTYNRNHSSAQGTNEIAISSNVVHVIHVHKTSQDHSNKTEELHLIANPKLSSIEPANKNLTAAQAELLANQLRSLSHVDIIDNTYSTVLSFVYGKPSAGCVLNRVPIDIPDESTLTDSTKYRSPELFVETTDGRFGEVFSSGYNNIHLRSFNNSQFTANHLCRSLVISKHYSYRNHYTEDANPYTFNSDDQFFNVEIAVKSPTGNEIKCLLRR